MSKQMNLPMEDDEKHIGMSCVILSVPMPACQPTNYWKRKN